MIEQSVIHLEYIQNLALILHNLGYCASTNLLDVSKEYESYRLSIYTFTSLA
jgi:hypothetical protein